MSINRWQPQPGRQCQSSFAEVPHAPQSRISWPTIIALAMRCWSRSSTLSPSATGNWPRSEFAHYRDGMLHHFAAEESVLFPLFEQTTGMYQGPTQVMRGEHAQMRLLLTAAASALAEQDVDDYAGNAETLLIMMQQHNVKEENVLYPMCDQHLADQVKVLLPTLQTQIAGLVEVPT
jgi:hemerythrin superfamily protein